MNTVTLTEHVVLPDDTRIIQLHIANNGVRAVLDDRYRPGYDLQVRHIEWDKLSDVDYLSTEFDTEAVRTFKILVGMLGKIQMNKHIYEALT